jgi:hypothetical protein
MDVEMAGKGRGFHHFGKKTAVCIDCVKARSILLRSNQGVAKLEA